MSLAAKIQITSLKNRQFTFSCFPGQFLSCSFVDYCYFMNYRLRQNTAPRIYRQHLVFLSATVVMRMIFCIEDDFCIISDYRNAFNGNRPEACNIIKKETLAQVFSCEFCEISKNILFTEHLHATASQNRTPNRQNNIKHDI